MGKNKPDVKRVERISADVLQESVARLRELFPEVVTEGKVDFAKLREALGDEVDDRPERYSFTWAGKRDAIRLLQVPSRATLVPCPKESVDWDSTQNLFIEGENLEVLKLLYKSYAGRVKMIYIDPPYNTGNDFIYPDNFADPLDTYLKLTGQKDSEGNLLTSNPETSGRYHSAWLSMMYPRLFVARQLMREDGVICVSIDDFEARGLRMLMDSIYGEENFIAQLVWEKGRKNDAKLFSVGHEYMVVYARSKAALRESKTIWREPKPGAQEIWDQYGRLREKYGSDDAAVEAKLVEWFQRLPAENPSKSLSRYKHVDKYGPWRDRDVSWPGGGGPRYEVIHPRTKKPCKVPEAGWRFSTREAMEQRIRLGMVEFREDHSQPPFLKAHLKPRYEELRDEDNIDSAEESSVFTNGEEGDAEVGMQVMPSVIYKQSQVAVKYLQKLMGAKVFDNPKDHEVLGRIIRYCTSPGDVVLDFFAGSGSTAEGVLWLNSEGAGDRQFIVVQLPEPTRRMNKTGTYKDTAANKAGYETIADLARDRIRRAAAVISKESDGKLDLGGGRPDLGFKCFGLAESNYRPWKGVEKKDGGAYAETMGLFTDPLVPGWKPTNVVYEVALKEGYSLTAKVEKVDGLKDNTVYRVTDADKGQSFRISLDDRLKAATVKALALKKDDLFICRDAALTDEQAANLALQCNLKTI